MTSRNLRILLSAALATLATAAPAGAAITELAALGDSKPGCPGFDAANCRIVVVRQTVFQVKVGTTKAITSAPSSGHVVAWTVSLSAVPSNKLADVNDNYGGAPRAALVVLSPLGKSRFQVVQKGPLVDLTPYLGTAPTFALPTALPVKKGQVVGLSVPTWAPMIQLGLGTDTSWRSSKPLAESVSENFKPQRALVGDAAQASFAALYTRARLAYSASFVPAPAAAAPTKSTTKSKSKAPASTTPTATTPTSTTPATTPKKTSSR